MRLLLERRLTGHVPAGKPHLAFLSFESLTLKMNIFSKTISSPSGTQTDLSFLPGSLAQQTGSFWFTWSWGFCILYVFVFLFRQELYFWFTWNSLRKLLGLETGDTAASAFQVQS